MTEKHALVTGPQIAGRIPHGDGFIDVTPDVVYLDTPEEVAAVAESIELEHAVRGTHPVQTECAALAPLNDAIQDKDTDDLAVAVNMGVADHRAVVKAHQNAHKALNDKAGL